MTYKSMFLFFLISSSLFSKGPLIDVKDKKAIKKELAAVALKVEQLWSYYDVYIEHRDKVREVVAGEVIRQLKGLAIEQIDKVFGKAEKYEEHLENLKESIFVIDPKGFDKWLKILNGAGAVTKIYPELGRLEEETLQGQYDRGIERVQLEQKKYLLEQLERIQAISKDLKNLKKINEERIGRYKEMLTQLKDHSTAKETVDGSWNQPMAKSKLLLVAVEIKKEIVTLKRSIFNIIKMSSDEEIRFELINAEGLKHVF